MSLAREVRHILNTLRGEAVVEGIRFPLDGRILSKRMRRRLAGTKYEAKEVQASAAAVRPGDVVLELGAGIGFVSSYLRKRTPAGPIICIEANPDLIPYIRQVHHLNGITDTNVLHGVALPSASSEPMQFYCRRDFWASSLDPAPAYERAVHVEGIPFSKLISAHHPNLLVMDIEGGELELLSVGAIESVRTIIVEVHPKVYGAPGLEAVETHMARHSFHAAANSGGGNVRVYHRSGT